MTEPLDVERLQADAEAMRSGSLLTATPGRRREFGTQVLALLALTADLRARPSVTCVARDRHGVPLPTVQLLGDRAAVEAVIALRDDRNDLLLRLEVAEAALKREQAQGFHVWQRQRRRALRAELVLSEWMAAEDACDASDDLLFSTADDPIANEKARDASKVVGRQLGAARGAARELLAGRGADG